MPTSTNGAACSWTTSTRTSDRAYAAGAKVDDPEILAFLSPQGPLRSVLPRGWKEAQEQAALEGETLANPFKRTIVGSGDETIETLELNGAVSLKHLDYIKRGLDDILSQERGNKARLLRKVKNEFVGKLDNKFDDYRAARAQYRGDAEMRDSLEAGRAFLSERSDITMQALRGMSDPEKQAFRVGAITAIRDAISPWLCPPMPSATTKC